ncbi:Protein GrpE [Aliiroseovarius sp. xm-m-379]|uniref:Protein GrpE n=3 Tax=Aliiroseovarius TaxID=1658781 RepID=A0A0P7IRZ1_9RHOB|nr:molecular chaperone GrpE [Aliiroseovarius crassostreae]NRP26032.1 Protein GrpE [Aliiroseovarius sp. xm-m-379]NRP30399.1 Protein GrpE [Aliiroseovarius sp. xm-m-314]NRP34831.1 Protein GrpE [Aliiroseovarius sp. xm-a-104]NRP42889.1 Protein GrpE [Aliiroseovarius sp. xm-m-378]NRP49957.1 Protein GrpE [Aliiroseovarius sp. xm-m-354]NRP63760.1 Protein GrpE [Aliiroseovarius sp. xm-v-225]NRP80041.1 Protein GrpE [Aliiroseovarius sp. xm-v-209]NRP90821.1 Protein GrpE [Aliiroseovarius sp. xm-a-134]NRQ0
MTDVKKTPAEDVEAAIQELMTEQAGDEPMSLDDLANELPPSEEILALQAERDEYKDRFMRALADAENARKRSDRDRREAENYGGSKLARDMLPVFDNMKRAVEAASKVDNEASKPLIEGIELTMRSLLGIFEKHGIRLVSPEVGDKFDPEQHEAMFEAPVPGTKAGDVIQVMAEGFMIHDRLLRPAQVGVSSTPA